MRNIIFVLISVIVLSALIVSSSDQQGLEEYTVTCDALVASQSDLIDESISQIKSCIENVDIAMGQTEACVENLEVAVWQTWACNENLEIQKMRYHELKCYKLANLLNERFGYSYREWEGGIEIFKKGGWEIFVDGKRVDLYCNSNDQNWEYMPEFMGCEEN